MNSAIVMYTGFIGLIEGAYTLLIQSYVFLPNY
jgi:hypothetical protein